MDLSKALLADLIEEVLSRDDGLSSIDGKVLADELIERNNSLDVFEKGTLIEALRSRKEVDAVSSPYDWNDYCVSIENGQMIHRTGKSTILIIEGEY